LWLINRRFDELQSRRRIVGCGGGEAYQRTGGCLNSTHLTASSYAKRFNTSAFTREFEKASD